MARAGLLKHVIEIQQPIETQDGSGSVVNSWLVYLTVHAQLLPQAGSEAVLEGHTQAFSVVKFNIRFKKGITPKMRIVYDGRTFDILNLVDVRGVGRDLEITCKEAV